MKHQASRDLYAYWNSLRGARTAPERAEIEPAAIRDVLADTFMLDIDLAHTFPIRLSGTRFNGLFDAEQKGRSFLNLWRAEERRNVAAVLLTVVDGACPVVVGGAAAPAGQSDTAAFEFLFLPLRHHGKTHARLLGIATPAQRREPAWLGLLPPGPMALRTLRIVDNEGLEASARAPMRVAVGQSLDPRMDVAPTGSLLFGSGTTVQHRPSLRVIQGGRAF